MRVLMVTSEWPTPDESYRAPFISRQVEFLRQEGLAIEVFHFRGGTNVRNYLKAWRRVRELTVQGGFDLVHAQWGQSALLCLPRKLPLVVTYRGSDLAGIFGSNGRKTLRGWILAVSSRWVSLFANQVIVVSEHLAKTLPSQVRYDVIPSGVDLDVFKPIDKQHARTQLGWHPTKHAILFGGDPAVPGKRFSLAQQVIDTLRDRGLDPHLVQARGIRHRDMPLYINASDVMLLTSVSEGSPNVVKEALACNVPVVSTDVGDVRLRIGDIAGCHVCEESVSALADAVEKVLTSDQPSVEGRTTVLALDERVLAKKVRQIYESVYDR